MSITSTYRFRLAAFGLLNLVRAATVAALLVGAAAQLVTLAANLRTRSTDQANGLSNETGYFVSTDIPTAAGGTVGFALGHVLIGQSEEGQGGWVYAVRAAGRRRATLTRRELRGLKGSELTKTAVRACQS